MRVDIFLNGLNHKNDCSWQLHLCVCWGGGGCMFDVKVSLLCFFQDCFMIFSRLRCVCLKFCVLGLCDILIGIKIKLLDWWSCKVLLGCHLFWCCCCDFFFWGGGGGGRLTECLKRTFYFPLFFFSFLFFCFLCRLVKWLVQQVMLKICTLLCSLWKEVLPVFLRIFNLWCVLSCCFFGGRGLAVNHLQLKCQP